MAVNTLQQTLKAKHMMRMAFLTQLKFALPLALDVRPPQNLNARITIWCRVVVLVNN